MYSDLKAMENYLLSNYLNNTARSPPHLWASKEVVLGHAFHTTSESESTNRVLRDFVKPGACEINQVHDLTRVVRRYNKNIISSSLDHYKTRKKSKKRIIKSMILCGLYSQVKSLRMYHQQESKSNEDLKTLKKCMLMIAGADNLVKSIMKNDKLLEQVVQRHLNVMPQDAQFLGSYIEG